MAESPLPSDPEALLALDGFVRALARCLVADENDADDVAQQTWIVALSGGRRGPSMRAWLAGIARNVASKLQRKKVRVERIERAAARDERVPTNDEVREHEAARREVVEAVLALDEPYRAAVLLRFLAGLPPREIARRTGVPVETVRTRIKRGIDRVRLELDNRHKGYREAWCRALLPLAVPEVVTGGAVIAAGVAWMAKVKTVAAALCVAALSIAVWALVRGNEAHGDAARDALANATSGALVRSGPENEPTPEADPAESQPMTRTRVASPVETTGSLLVRVVRPAGFSSVTALPDVHLRLVPKGLEPAIFDERSAVTDAGGLATFPGLAPGRVAVTSSFGSSAVAEIRTGLRAELTLENRMGQVFEGIVVDADGRPVAGAEVRVFHGGEHPSWPVARSASDGTFRIQASAMWLEARAKGWSPSARYRVDSLGERRVRVVLGPPSGRLAGRVLEAQGNPVANALVLVGTEGTAGEELGSSLRRGQKLEDLTWGLAPQPGCFRTDAGGRFRGDDLPPGRHAVTARGPSSAAWHGEVEITAGREAFLPIELVAGGILEGTVRDATGKPLAGVDVAHAAWDALVNSSTSTKEDGTYRFTGLPAGQLRVAARSSTLGTIRATIEIRAQQRNLWSPTLMAGATLRGRVLDERGEGLPDARVDSATADRSWSSGSQVDEQGRFAIPGCPDAPLELTVLEAGVQHPSATRNDVRAGAEEVVIRLRAEDRATVTIHGRLLGLEEKPVPGVSVNAFTIEQRKGVEAKVDAESGEFTIGPCPSGEWHLWIHAPDRADVTVPGKRLGPNERWEVGTVRLEKPGWLEVEARREDGLPLPDGLVFSAWQREGAGNQALWANAGRVQRAGFGSGTWILRPCGQEYATESFEVRIVSGETTSVRVELRPGFAQHVSIQLPDGDDARIVDVGVREATGRQVLQSRIWRQGSAHTCVWPLSLAPGKYELEAKTTGHQGKAKLVVVAGKPAEPVKIEMH